MPYKRQKTTRSNKKNGIYDLMTDLGLGVFIQKKQIHKSHQTHLQEKKSIFLCRLTEMF